MSIRVAIIVMIVYTKRTALLLLSQPERLPKIKGEMEDANGASE